jgi:hypothetical protein
MGIIIERRPINPDRRLQGNDITGEIDNDTAFCKRGAVEGGGGPPDGSMPPDGI